MTTATFFLLDINGETTAQGSHIRLWGVDIHGEDVLIVDNSFKPYFYAIPKDDVSTDRLIVSLSSMESDLDDGPQLVVEEKKLFGRTLKAVKVICESPEALEEVAKRVAKHQLVEQVLENDIRYSSLYLLDKGLIPCRWHEALVEEFRLPDAQVAHAYRAIATPRVVSLDGIPKFRVLAFSAMAFAENHSPHATEDPVSILSVATSDGQARSFTRSDETELDVITKFTEFIREFDPQIVAGFESNTKDWPYLIERARRLGATLAVSRARSEPHTSVYGHVSITGRANLDLLDYANEVPEVKVKSLENVAAFLGIKLQQSPHDEFEFAKVWKGPQGRRLLVGYSEARAMAMLEMTKRFLEFGVELSSLTTMPLDQVVTASVGHRVDSYLLREAHKQGHLVPHRSEQTYQRYQGAVVLAPQKGLHENVVALDFASMYPNLMMLYNLSPDTLISRSEKADEEACWLIEGLGYRFRKTPPGLYKNALAELISFRGQVKKKLKEKSLSDTEKRVLQERQRAVKVITNACYGYAGWTGARWYVREVAESAAALGRKSITQVIERCKEIELPIVYADTDSVFVENDEARVEPLLHWVNENLHMDIRPDKTYRRVLFTEAKKRYAGVLVDGTLDIVGMEVVRGDWSDIARHVQERVIELVLKDAAPDRAKEYVLNTIDRLRRREVPTRDLIIWKSLTKRIEEYKVNAPHVEVAKKYLRSGRELQPGDKIGYIITKEGTRLYERAQPYFAVTPDQVDVEYYVSNQVVAATARILEVFKIGEEQLLSGRERSLQQSTLR